MDIESIMISFITSSIGLAYVVYGKKRAKLWHALSGVGLMSYTYFVDGKGISLVIGGILMVAPFILDR